MTKVLLVSGCDANFYGWMSEMLHSQRDQGILDRPGVTVGILDQGLTPEQVSELRAQGYQVVKPEWTIDVPHELRKGFMIGNIARTALRQYFPGHEVYLWFDADAWVQTPEYFDRMVAGALSKGAAIVAEDGFGMKRDYLYNRWWYGHLIMEYGIINGLRVAWPPAFNMGIFALAADAPHWSVWTKRLASIITNRRVLNMDQHAFCAIITLDKLPCTVLPARCDWISVLSAPHWDSASRCFCDPAPNGEPLSVLHLAGPDKKQIYQLTNRQGGTLATPLTYPDYLRLRG